MKSIRLSAALVLGSLVVAAPAGAFSQRSPVTPIGHESITTFGYLRSAGLSEDNTQALADLDSKDPKGTLVRAAILGVRWVDLMGYAFLNPWGSTATCWDIVAQSNVDVQYDHALRTDFDTGEEGRRRTMIGTISRARRAFVSATNSAPGSTFTIRDGGAGVDRYSNVDAAGFWLGVALHPLQDGYSPEHTRRVAKDLALTTIDDHGRDDRLIWVDATNYNCESSMWQHTHVTPTSADKNKDVIWVGDTGKDAAHPYGQIRFVLPYVKPAIATTEALFRAYSTARVKPESERAAVFDDLVALPYYAFLLDDLAITSPAGALCDSKTIKEMDDKRSGMECLREQCLNALESANLPTKFGLTPPLDYNPAVAAPSDCRDPIASYSR